jgi:large subunit ribosomal protein L15
MKLHTLKPAPGSKKNRKRIGRGAGSGMGETSGKGHKGALARSGATKRHYHEGGQMPMHRRLPKFGFTNIFKKEFQIINVGQLDRMDSSEVTAQTLHDAGLIKSLLIPVKVLGVGDVKKAFTVKAAAFSKSAIDKLQGAGGTAEVLK